jgi:hypothetical protein
MDFTWIALFVIVALISLVMISWPLLWRRFLRQYYAEKYQPIEISQEVTEGLPVEHHLAGVPWITAEKQLCQSTSLQMIAAVNGVDYPRPYHDFLMGFTYGASRVPGMGFSPLGSDPEIDMQFAAPYLGLARLYYVSKDRAVFCSALRTFLAQDLPVRLALDMGSLYGEVKFIAHSVVLVGYDAGGFYYYETVACPPATAPAGERQPGEKGQYVSEETLLKAIERLSSTLRYPWRYALTIFEAAETLEDLRPVWARNGSLLLDENKYGPKMGVRVLEELADEIIRDGVKFPFATIRDGLDLAVTVRQDNANFLREIFAQNVDALQAAEAMDQAAKNYGLALEDMQSGIGSQIDARRLAVRLRDAAAAERKSGEIFIKLGKQEE